MTASKQLPSDYNLGFGTYSDAYDGAEYWIDPDTGLCTASGMVKSTTADGTLPANTSYCIVVPRGPVLQTRTLSGRRTVGCAAAVKIGTQILPALCFADVDGSIYIQSPVAGRPAWIAYNLTYRALADAELPPAGG